MDSIKVFHFLLLIFENFLIIFQIFSALFNQIGDKPLELQNSQSLLVYFEIINRTFFF